MGLTLFPGGRERFPQGTPHGPGASDLQCGFQGVPGGKDCIAGDRQDKGRGAGSQDNGVWRQALQQRFVRLRAAAQVHPCLTAFDDEGADGLGQLTLAGGVGGDEDGQAAAVPAGR